jgi:signal transduction histidine kinase
MANMLSREIYGSLTPKQREYADIVRDSSQQLLQMANEVLELSSLDARIQPLRPTSVDIDMIGQHVQRMLSPLAQQKNQELHFTVDPGSRLWTLDRDVVQQLLYHLIFCIIQLAGEGGTIRVHCTERDSELSINVWTTHPWLGEGLPNTVAQLHKRIGGSEEEAELLLMLLARATGRLEMTAAAEQAADFKHHPEVLQARETLSLLLSRHLIERHKGSLILQGNADSGYRYAIMLPFLNAPTAVR